MCGLHRLLGMGEKRCLHEQQSPCPVRGGRTGQICAKLRVILVGSVKGKSLASWDSLGNAVKPLGRGLPAGSPTHS